jgi:hypothetical protein
MLAQHLSAARRAVINRSLGGIGAPRHGATEWRSVYFSLLHKERMSGIGGGWVLSMAALRLLSGAAVPHAKARWRMCGDRFRRDPFLRQADLFSGSLGVDFRICRSSCAHLPNRAGASRSWCRWMLGIVGGEKPLGSGQPPRLRHDLSHLVEVNLPEPHQEPWIAVVVRGDEELARVGPEQFIAFFHAGAAHEECVWQLMNTEKQVVAYTERGKPVVRALGAPGQRQGHPADVLFGDHLRMLRQLIPMQRHHPLCR